LIVFVNHMFVSGPAAIPKGRATLPAGSSNVVITPSVVIRPIRSLKPLVNHRFSRPP
jgi:hypothetical protein